MSINKLTTAYLPPYVLFSNLRGKSPVLQNEVALDTLTLVGGKYKTKSIAMEKYPSFGAGNIYMRVDFEITSGVYATLTDSDVVDVYIQSGTVIDPVTKVITTPTFLPNLAFNSDEFIGQQISNTPDVVQITDIAEIEHAEYGAKATISKASFSLQDDGTYFASKFITFPKWNTDMGMTFDAFYGVAIEPKGAMIANADVKFKSDFWYYNIPVSQVKNIINNY